MARKEFFLLILFLAPQNLCTADIQITGNELDFRFSPEYHRALQFCWDISAAAAVMLNSRYTLKSGLAMGAAGSSFAIKAFTGGEALITARFPLCIGLAYNYNALPAYENRAHSALLLSSLRYKRAGFFLGYNFRFTSFFGEPPVFEPVLLISVYVFFIDNDILRLGIKTANFDDFSSGTLGAYFLNLNSLIRLGKKLSLINEIEIRQSGSIALASNFYGIVYRGGAAISW